MSEVRIDLEQVVEVLKNALRPQGKFSMRGLSAAAGLTRDTVSDIIHGRNKNPTIKTLSALAKGMDRDITVFGIIEPTEGEKPSEDDMALALGALASSYPGVQIEARVQRPAASALVRLLQLIEADPAIRSNPDALREVVRTEVAQPLRSKSEA